MFKNNYINKIIILLFILFLFLIPKISFACLTVKITDLKEQLAVKQIEHQQKCSEFLEIAHEISELELSLSMINMELVVLRGYLEVIKKVNGPQIATYKAYLTELYSALGEAEIIGDEDKIKAIKEQIEITLIAIKQLEDQIKQIENNIDRKSYEKGQIEGKLNQKNADSQKILQEIAELFDVMEKLESEIQIAERRFDELTTQMGIISKQIDDIENEINIIWQRIMELMSQQEGSVPPLELGELYAQLAQLEAELAAKNSELEVLHKEQGC